TCLSRDSTAFSLRALGRTQLAVSTSLFHETRVSHAWVCHHIRDPRSARRHLWLCGPCRYSRGDRQGLAVRFPCPLRDLADLWQEAGARCLIFVGVAKLILIFVGVAKLIVGPPGHR